MANMQYNVTISAIRTTKYTDTDRHREQQTMRYIRTRRHSEERILPP